MSTSYLVLHDLRHLGSSGPPSHRHVLTLFFLLPLSNMSHASEMIVRLSGQDRNGVDMISITVGYVLDVDGVDASQVDQAFRRVCEKWRLLAGRIEWSKKVRRDSTRHSEKNKVADTCTKQHGVWTVRTPLVEPLPADYKTHGFTSSTSTSPLGVPIPNLTPSSAEFLPSQPSSAAFRDPTVPKTTSAMASNKHPLVSLHVSTFSDCTTVGITFPHSVFDGTGMGSVISALDCELNRRPWTPPAFQEENILEVELLKEIVVPEGTTIPEPNRDFVPFSIFNLARFLAALVYERLWHKDTMGGIFLGEEAQQKLVDEVKGQVKRETGGREFVSTGDVLYAWFLKVREQCTTLSFLSKVFSGVCGLVTLRASMLTRLRRPPTSTNRPLPTSSTPAASSRRAQSSLPPLPTLPSTLTPTTPRKPSTPPLSPSPLSLPPHSQPSPSSTDALSTHHETSPSFVKQLKRE